MIILPIFLWLFKINCTFSSAIPLLKRLRWLFLSLLILNLWLTTFTWLPSIDGLLLALDRIVALFIIVLAAHLFLHTTPTQDIIATWQWWLKPFKKFGSERLAVRLALVLDTVATVQNLYLNLPSTSTTNPLKKIGEQVAGLFIQVLNHAETTPLRTLEIPKLQPPPWWQWSLPLFMLILILSG